MSKTILVNEAGSYTVTITSGTGCVGRGEFIVGLTNESPDILVLNDTLACDEKINELGIEENGSLRFDWSNGVNTPTIWVDERHLLCINR